MTSANTTNNIVHRLPAPGDVASAGVDDGERDSRQRERRQQIDGAPDAPGPDRVDEQRARRDGAEPERSERRLAIDVTSETWKERRRRNKGGLQPFSPMISKSLARIIPKKALAVLWYIKGLHGSKPGKASFPNFFTASASFRPHFQLCHAPFRRLARHGYESAQPFAGIVCVE